MRPLALVLAVLLLAPATASAQKVEDTFFNSTIPSRIDHLIGFTPTVFAIHPRGQRVVPITVRVGGRTYRYTFGGAAAAVAPSADLVLRNMIRGRRYPSPEGIFLDRRLTAAERRHVHVRADLGRDADVLVVARGHPACTSGVSRAAAKGIAAGRIRTWSSAGVPEPASGNVIALRRAGEGIDGFAEPRFGAGGKMPKGARAARDGGLSAAASGNLAIAAVTSWSRARAYQSTTCAVAVGGAAPSDASVRALSHRDAYPISFVTLRRLGGRDRGVRPITAAFVKYLTGPQAATSFRQRGMLLVKEAWRPVAQAQPDPQPEAPPEPTAATSAVAAESPYRYYPAQSATVTKRLASWQDCPDSLTWGEGGTTASRRGVGTLVYKRIDAGARQKWTLRTKQKVCGVVATTFSEKVLFPRFNRRHNFVDPRTAGHPDVIRTLAVFLRR